MVPLENNPEQGIFLIPSGESTGCDGDIYWCQFSPTQRLLFLGGNFDKPSLWDLRGSSDQFKLLNMLPHVQGKVADQLAENQTDVSSVHWNNSGDKLVTSSSDCYSRVWKVEEHGKSTEDCSGVYRLKNFKIMLMMSKFNKGAGELIASGGHSSTVTVWNYETGKNLATFDHREIDPGFVCQEIEWQNPKTLAVSGKS